MTDTKESLEKKLKAAIKAWDAHPLSNSAKQLVLQLRKQLKDLK